MINHFFRYEPFKPSSFVCQPAAALLSFGDGQVEVFSQNSKCNQQLFKFLKFPLTGHTIDLLDNQLLIIGDQTLGARWQYIIIHNPRNGLLAPTYSEEVSPIKGSPHKHNSFTMGNKLVVIGGDQKAKAILDTDIWNKLNLRWKNQSTFSLFTSSACKVKITKDSHLIIGGILKEKHQVLSTILKINLTDETVEEWLPMKKSRYHHSCELMNGSYVVLISGGIEKSVSPNTSNAILPDELYNIWSKESVLLAATSSINRYQHRLIRLQDTVFSVGGKNYLGSPMTLIKRFNSNTNSWEDNGEHTISKHTGEVSVTAFPLAAVDCVAGCKCGVSRVNTASRITNGTEAKVTLTFFST